MPSLNYRHRARQHVQRAKDHLVDGKSETLRYACLELRMAIEALTYERLEAYLAEVSNDVMKKWQPKQVLTELLFVDPAADSSGRLWVGREDQFGVPAKEMRFLGTDERFTVKWASKAHNTLGGFLHEPTIAQLTAGKESEETIRARAAEIVTELERVLSARLSNVNFGVFCTIPCECGFTIKRKEEFVRRGENAVCASCGRIYEVSIMEETRQFAYKLARVNYECANCKTERWIARHELDKEPVLVCSSCDSKAKVVRVFSLEDVPVKSAAE